MFFNKLKLSNLTNSRKDALKSIQKTKSDDESNVFDSSSEYGDFSLFATKKGSWKAEDNEIFAQLDKKGYSLEDIFTVVDENEDGEISSEEIGKIAALDGKDSISTDDFESLINQISKADIEGQVDTQEELFELLGVNAQGELPQDSSALKQQIYNMYLSSKDSPEEAFSWANDYKEEKARIEEFSKNQDFCDLFHIYYGNYYNADSSPLEIYESLTVVSFDECDQLNNLLGEKKNKFNEVSAIASYFYENGKEIPESIKNAIETLNGDAFDMQNSFATTPWAFQENLNSYTDTINDTLDTIGCLNYSTGVNEEGVITSVSMTIPNQDGSVSVVDLKYSEDGKNIVEKNETKIETDGTKTTNNTIYNPDGTFVTTDGSGKVVNGSADVVLSNLSDSSDKRAFALLKTVADLLNDKTLKPEEQWQQVFQLQTETPKEVVKNLGNTELTQKLSDANTLPDMLEVLNSFTNGDAATSRLLLNTIFQDASVKSALGGAEIVINENNEFVINSAVEVMNLDNPLKDKENLMVKALFDYRNGMYVLSDNVLSALSQNSIVKDENGNILSGIDYYVDPAGELCAVKAQYEYENGEPVKISSFNYDVETGKLKYTEENIITTENGEKVVNTTRTDANGNVVTKTETLSKFEEIKNLESIARKYTDRTDLSEEELYQVLTIDYLANNNATIKDILLDQDYEDGIISQGYNGIKAATGWGIDRDDVSVRIISNDMTLNNLIAAINNPELDFKDAYKNAYGVEYDQAKIDKARILESEMEIYSSSQAQLSNINSIIEQYYKDGKTSEIQNVLATVYGDKEVAAQKYNEFVAEKEFLSGIACQQASDIESKFIEFYGSEEVGKQKYQTYVNSGANAITNCIYDDLTKNLKTNMSQYGINTDTLVQDYMDLSLEAFGKNSQVDLEKLVTDYTKDQTGFVNTFNGIVQTTGTVLLIGGSIVAIVSSGGAATPIAMGMITAGRTISMVGIFGGDALSLIEEATSKNVSSGEIRNILIDAGQDLALHYSGRLIGKFSNAVHSKIADTFIEKGLSKAGAQALGNLGEVLVDMPLSLLADYGITGSVNLSGEGFSQLLSVMTGIATEKINIQKIKTAEETLNADTLSAVASASVPVKAKDRVTLLSSYMDTDTYGKRLFTDEQIKLLSKDQGLTARASALAATSFVGYSGNKLSGDEIMEIASNPELTGNYIALGKIKYSQDAKESAFTVESARELANDSLLTARISALSTVKGDDGYMLFNPDRLIQLAGSQKITDQAIELAAIKDTKGACALLPSDIVCLASSDFEIGTLKSRISELASLKNANGDRILSSAIISKIATGDDAEAVAKNLSKLSAILQENIVNNTPLQGTLCEIAKNDKMTDIAVELDKLVDANGKKLFSIYYISNILSLDVDKIDITSLKANAAELTSLKTSYNTSLFQPADVLNLLLKSSDIAATRVNIQKLQDKGLQGDAIALLAYDTDVTERFSQLLELDLTSKYPNLDAVKCAQDPEYYNNVIALNGVKSNGSSLFRQGVYYFAQDPAVAAKALELCSIKDKEGNSIFNSAQEINTIVTGSDDFYDKILELGSLKQEGSDASFFYDSNSLISLAGSSKDVETLKSNLLELSSLNSSLGGDAIDYNSIVKMAMSDVSLDTIKNNIRELSTLTYKDGKKIIPSYEMHYFAENTIDINTYKSNIQKLADVNYIESSYLSRNYIDNHTIAELASDSNLVSRMLDLAPYKDSLNGSAWVELAKSAMSMDKLQKNLDVITAANKEIPYGNRIQDFYLSMLVSSDIDINLAAQNAIKLGNIKFADGSCIQSHDIVSILATGIDSAALDAKLKVITDFKAGEGKFLTSEQISRIITAPLDAEEIKNNIISLKNSNIFSDFQLFNLSLSKDSFSNAYKLLEYKDSEGNNLFTQQQIYELSCIAGTKSLLETDKIENIKPIIEKINHSKDLTSFDAEFMVQTILLAQDPLSMSFMQKINVIKSIKAIMENGAYSRIFTDAEKAQMNLEEVSSKIQESLKNTITPTKVTSEDIKAMSQGFFANNNPDVENVLKTTDFTKFGKEGLPLEYPRTDFLADLSLTIGLLPSSQKSQIIKKLGIEVKEEGGKITGYDGIIDLSKLDLDNPLEKAVYDKAYRFIKENKVVTGNKELDDAMNALITGMPEFVNVIGKQQHATHDLSVDSHIMAVLQNAMSNPAYANLSELDKTALKYATVLHDIAKSEGQVDKQHPDTSALFARNILEKYPFSKDIKDRIFELVKNHHWLEGYNTGDTTSDMTATNFRHKDDYSIAKIMAEADLKGVSDDFYERYRDALSDESQIPVSDSLARINSKGQLLFSSKIVKEDLLPTVNYRGEDYRVMDFSQVSADADLSQYGFAPGTTKDNLRLLVHMAPSAENLSTVDLLSDIANGGFLCASYVSLAVKPTYANQSFGVSLEVENVNVANAANANQGSGCGKDLSRFSQIISGNDPMSTYRDMLPNAIKASLGISDKGYTELYEQLASKKYLSQIRDDNTYTIEGRTFTGTQIREAITAADDLMIKGQQNETNLYNPSINALVAKVDSIGEIPQEFLDFAKARNLPIYLLGK